ncbi:MAG: hypothetical protein LBR32_08795 [Propionibacteriaceae bacterium]|jgi:hypothetical protein|nr:hypothetical protein [Propionibacteriaceae bacterium]
MSDEYRGEQVQIGGGFGGLVPLAQHGAITISDGLLTLLGSDGQVLVQAPANSVTVKQVKMTRGQSVLLMIDQKKYSVSVGWGEKLGQRIGVVGAVSREKDTREATQAFVEALLAAGGVQA